MIQAKFQNSANDGAIHGIRTKNKRNGSISDKKGPMKACYNPQEDKWALKYSYRSSQTVQDHSNHSKPTSAKRRFDKNCESSSDYGTMSRPDPDEENLPQLQEPVPSLNLIGGSSNKMNTFNDVSIALRRERIDNILSDIMAVPRLIESNLSRRTLSRSSSVRRHVSNDRTSEAGSVANSRASGSVASSRVNKRNHASSSSLRRSVSSPKLDYIPEIKSTNKKSRENIKLGKIPEMPPVKQAVTKLKKKPGGDSRVAGLDLNNTTRDQLSVEHLPHKDELLTKLVPSLGDQTKNELVINAPTLGDDTQDDLVISSLTLEDDTFGEPYGDEVSQLNLEKLDTFSGDEGPVDYVRQNIMKAAVHSKGADSGRSTASTMISTKHKTGSVPKYLKTRQAEWRDAEAAALAAIPDPDCPPGHRLLPQEERLSRLEMRKERHKELLEEVNRLPVSSDTRRVRLRRAELEAELAQLEGDITVYNRHKVFVKAGEEEDSGQAAQAPTQTTQRGQSVLSVQTNNSVDWPM